MRRGYDHCTSCWKCSRSGDVMWKMASRKYCESFPFGIALSSSYPFSKELLNFVGQISSSRMSSSDRRLVKYGCSSACLIVHLFVGSNWSICSNRSTVFESNLWKICLNFPVGAKSIFCNSCMTDGTQSGQTQSYIQASRWLWCCDEKTLHTRRAAALSTQSSAPSPLGLPTSAIDFWSWSK